MKIGKRQLNEEEREYVNKMLTKQGCINPSRLENDDALFKLHLCIGGRRYYDFFKGIREQTMITKRKSTRD